MGNKVTVTNAKPLGDNDLDFLARNTPMSREQVEEKYRAFLRDQPDGQVDQKEFEDFMRKFNPTADIDKLSQLTFRIYDHNGDGFIDFREFMLVVYTMASATPQERLKQIFRIFDVNDDKEISRDELKKIVSSLYDLLEEDGNPYKTSQETLVNMAFNEMDKNKDKKITEAEFIQAMNNNEKFTSLLSNKLLGFWDGLGES